MYSLDLQINVPLLKKGFVLEKFREPKHLRPPTEDVVSNEMFDFFEKQNLSIGSEIFFTPPMAHTTVHADDQGDLIKLNWIIGGKGSVMQWWKPRSEKPVVYTEHNSPTIRYKISEVSLLHTAVISQPSMVQVGIPHNVLNGGEHRWCISLIPVKKSSMARLSWNEGLEIFGRYAAHA
jgi:hypothetical protein